MQSIGEALQLRQVPVLKIKSKRAYVLSQFIDEITLERKIDNWRRYVRERRKTPMTPEQFKKHPMFLKPVKASYVAFKLAHLKVQDLEYLFSCAKDCKRRGGSFSKYVFGSIKAK